MIRLGRVGWLGLASLIVSATLCGQDEPAEGKRAFGVLPNFRTVEASAPFKPITAREKFKIGFHDSTDYPVFGFTAVVAGWSQLVNTHPYYGQGMKGYGKRFGAAYADVAVGNLMTESVMPALLHEDPRYFRKGSGSFKSRLGYAASRSFITRTDSGGNRFNFSEFAGSAVAAGVGNIYYRHERTTGDNFERFTTTIVTDMLSQMLNEFLPDISRKFLSRKKADPKH